MIAPSLTVRPLQASEADALMVRLNGVLAATADCAPFTAATLNTQLLQDHPPTCYPVRWQSHQRLCAWRAGEVEGFADLAIGFDSESLEQPIYRPLGLLRFLLLPSRPELVTPVAQALLAAMQAYWQTASVQVVKAFHPSTGYPNFQGGVGILPGDWQDHLSFLTGAEYQLHSRFYRFQGELDRMWEEKLPLAGLSLTCLGNRNDWSYQLYRGAEGVGSARLVMLPQMQADAAPWVHLLDLQVAAGWRNMNIGKWLLRRLLNDARLQGYATIVAHVAVHQYTALALLNQHSFVEQSYRGYALEKQLAQQV